MHRPNPALVAATAAASFQPSKIHAEVSADVVDDMTRQRSGPTLMYISREGRDPHPMGGLMAIAAMRSRGANTHRGKRGKVASQRTSRNKYA